MSYDAAQGARALLAARAGYQAARGVARQLALGRARTRLRTRIEASTMWTAVPSLRLKDLDRDGALPPGAVALTYDDGPDPNVTPVLLRLLEKYAARATFFMCGEAAKRHPQLVREIVAAGHSVGGHTWDHRSIMRRGLSDVEWRHQIDDTHAVLSDLTNNNVRWFRPPRGIIDKYTWTKLGRQGLTTILWSIDGADCTLRDPKEVADRVLSSFGAGDIALLHDANANFLYATSRPRYGQLGNQESTVHATELILRSSRERNLIPVPLDLIPHQNMPRTGRPRVRLRR